MSSLVYYKKGLVFFKLSQSLYLAVYNLIHWQKCACARFDIL